jgi:flagellar hook-basal body complex protein FliE
MDVSRLQTRIDPDVGISGAQSIQSKATTESQPQGKGFLDLLNQSLEQVNTDQLNADSAVKDMVAGKNKNIHETMLALQKADLSLKTAMQVRNKILEAYKEIMRMQV